MTLRQKIRERLTDAAMHPRQPDAAAPLNDTANIHDDPTLKPASVLIPIVERENGMTILLTQRTEHLHAHGGQISFPGGHCEQFDRNAIDTALRETEEEIGITREHIDILGQLRDYDTVTGFRITPIVSMVRTGFTLTLDSFEVAEVFEIPLQHALDPNNYSHRTATHKGIEHRYCILDHDERYIWGATAAILFELSHHLDDVMR